MRRFGISRAEFRVRHLTFGVAEFGILERYMMRDAIHDLRYAVRLYRRMPGVAIGAVLVLALGIGANTTVFSLVNAVLLRPLPYAEPDRLVAVWTRNIAEKGPSKMSSVYADFEAYSRHARSLEVVAAATWLVGPEVLTGHGATREVLSIPVSPSFFSMLGVPAALGRTFTDADVSSGCAIVLSHRFWRTQLGSDPSLVGGTLTLSDRACRIAGIMPAGFAFYPEASDLWTLMGPELRPRREGLPLGIFARLRPGVTREQAQAELQTLFRANHAHDGLNRSLAPAVYDLQGEFTWLASRTLRSTLVAVTGAVVAVLLIACLNVATLLVGTSIVRVREIALREALGASRTRVVRQLLAEGFLLSLSGGGLGVFLAFAALRGFRAVNPIELRVGTDVGLDWPTLAFTTGLLVVTTIVFALLPAIRGAHVDVGEGLKSGGRGFVHGASGGALVNALVAGQTALSVALLLGAAVLLQSVQRLSHEPLGFDPRDLLTTSVTLPESRYAEPDRQRQFYAELESRLAALPGVTGVAVASERSTTDSLDIASHATNARPLVDTEAITPSSLTVLRVPLLRGRGLLPGDRVGTGAVAVVNEAFRRQYFPDTDVLGRQIRFGTTGTEGPWLTIVGVVGNMKGQSLYQEVSWTTAPTVFRPLEQSPQRNVSITIRTQPGMTGVGLLVPRTISAMDAGIPIHDVHPVEDRLTQQLSYPRFRAIVFSAFALGALLVAAVGLYGSVGQFVAQRRHEFAVRLALGASPREVKRLVVRNGAVPILVGLIAGLAASSSLHRVIGGLLYGTSAADPLLAALVSMVLLGAATAAMVIPARRAARVEPMAALRDE